MHIVQYEEEISPPPPIGLFFLLSVFFSNDLSKCFDEGKLLSLRMEPLPLTWTKLQICTWQGTTKFFFGGGDLLKTNIRYLRIYALDKSTMENFPYYHWIMTNGKHNYMYPFNVFQVNRQKFTRYKVVEQKSSSK